jgi:ATP-dependent RNA helicase RhlE
VVHVAKQDKRALLADVLSDPSLDRVLVFTRTKHGADRVVKHLRRIDVSAEAIHGNKSQGARERALNGFRSGSVRVLVATDIAARGIDVPEITHVINFDLPNVPESYVHRIGRTARAGRAGTAISFCSPDERADLRAIEKEIRMSVPVEDRAHGTITATTPKTSQDQPKATGGNRQPPRRRRPGRRRSTSALG